MTGDRHRPAGVIARWVNAFGDGLYCTTRRGKRRVPSISGEKRDERRWRRHQQIREDGE